MQGPLALNNSPRRQLGDRYEVERKLAQSTMAEVLVALDVKHGRRVAVKVLAVDVADGIGTERFLREIRFSARLTHPHILPLLDSGMTDGRPFYVMPFVDGETVRQRLDRLGRLPVEDAVSIAREIADALDYAHAADVLHRDVKPENVMMLGEHAVVLDFGIARAISAASELPSAQMTSAGITLGTPMYMSPEQAAGEKRLDGRSDQYSLGVMLFEMLAGEAPFAAPSARAVIARRFTHTPPSLEAVRADVPPHVAACVRRALSSEPDNRFETAGEFARALASPSGATSEPMHAPDAPSIAVIPFANVGGSAENEFLADGITDDVISALSRLRTLRVASRTSSYAMRGGGEDVAAVGKRLSVSTVLEGSVQRARERIRVSARLVNVRDGFQFWSEQFDRTLDDVFAIQDEISAAIVRTLKATLLGEDHAARPTPRSSSVEAYELYLKGRFFWNKRTEANLERAIAFFSQAIASDSAYAPALAGLADSYAVLGTYGARPPADVMPLAQENARRAVAMDPSLAEAHTTLGLTFAAYDRDWVAAEQAFRRAITIAPEYSTARQWYAVALLAPLRRFDEALAEIEHARSLDPLSLAVGATVGVIQSFAGQHEAAISTLRETLELEPGFGMAHFFLGQAYASAGRAAEAAGSAERAIALTGGTPEMLALLAQARVASGDRARGEALLGDLLRLRERRYVSAALVAQVRVSLGLHDDAIEDLERALASGDPEMLYLNVRAAYGPLRETPGFTRLLERAGLA
jgi:serine/threonine protein kinase/Tfp pilus assembly protein PilF